MNKDEKNLKIRYCYERMWHKRYSLISAVLFICLCFSSSSVQPKTFKGKLCSSISDFEIHKAVEECDLEEVKALLEKNPELIHAVGENDRNLLICAVIGGQKDMVEFLLSRGAAPDPEYVSGSGGTLLHLAASKGLMELSSLLIESGFDVDAKDRYGLTSLHLAALSNQKEVANLLISKGADLNAQSDSAWTPLRCAQEMNHMELVEFLVLKGASRDETGLTNMEGKYFGQAEAGFNPQLFSPGIVSSIFLEHSPVEFSPDGNEAYWTSDFREFGHTEGRIYFSMQVEGRWTSPRIAPFSEKMNSYNPVLSHDGNKMYFFAAPPSTSSQEPVPNIYVVEREGEEWSKPQIVEIPNTRGYLMTQFSLTKEGTLYFSTDSDDGYGSFDIFRSRLIEGKYTEPENLGDSINGDFWDSCPYIDPEERFLLFTSMGRPDSCGGMDLYISFQIEDGLWTRAVNMGDCINTKGVEALANCSPDGKWVFFVSDRNGNVDVYWMYAKVINNLRPENVKHEPRQTEDQFRCDVAAMLKERTRTIIP